MHVRKEKSQAQFDQERELQSFCRIKSEDKQERLIPIRKGERGGKITVKKRNKQ